MQAGREDIHVAGAGRTSVSMMSAAPLAAEVAPATAMPTLAFFSAGASFTPSPASIMKEFSISKYIRELYSAAVLSPRSTCHN